MIIPDPRQHQWLIQIVQKQTLKQQPQPEVIILKTWTMTIVTGSQDILAPENHCRMIEWVAPTATAAQGPLSRGNITHVTGPFGTVNELQDGGAQRHQIRSRQHRLNLNRTALWQRKVVGVSSHHEFMGAAV
jgi:hypothetical protein